jgi:phospholipid/cholesterol/gamma-HCH transport system permease protein
MALTILNGQSLQLYFTTVFSALTFADVIPATIKTFFFGFAIGLVGCNQGYNATRGTESVGIAANVSVIYSSLLVIIIDMIAVQLTIILF